MTEKQVRQIMDDKAFPETTLSVNLVETHISWVLLTDRHAYKFKKPVRFSFLDFSTLEKRYFYCRRELELNSRLAGGIYLRVLPVHTEQGRLRVGSPPGEVIDYTLQMKRMPSERQMNLLLEQAQVTLEDMEKIARQVAVFHNNTDVVDQPVDIEVMVSTFLDLLEEKDFIGKHLGVQATRCIDDCCDFAAAFLRDHARRLQERVEKGWLVDGHGDLHSRNIFLLEEPVIFDCIEFSDQLRCLDVLNEIAFFCLDLDFYKRPDLAAHFLRHYLAKMPCITCNEDRRLFHYFKLYRANVRLKVSALSAKQVIETETPQRSLDQMEEYFHLLKYYHSILAIEEKARL